MSPVEGSYFAYVTTGTQNVYTTLSRQLSVNAGDQLDFSVFFATKESYSTLYNDDGYAKLIELDGPTITLYSMSINSAGSDSIDGWLNKTHIFDTAGTYTLEFGVRNIGDSGVASYIGADHVRITPVPEPATFLFLAVGTLAFIKKHR